jgi:hypothetical protein
MTDLPTNTQAARLLAHYPMVCPETIGLWQEGGYGVTFSSYESSFSMT